jgi:hypothetical protein
MERFIQRFGEKIIGVLNGFDRLVFRGTLRSIAYPRGLGGFLWQKQVKLKDFGNYVYEVCEKVRDKSCEKAKELGRPIVYLKSSKIDKAATAERIAERDKIEKGLIAVISCLEPCIGYDVARNHQQKKLELVMRLRKCLFLYHYLIHPRFGFMNARIQSWFPFNIQVCINGREWLAKEMDLAGICYERRENCFAWIEDIEAAQELMNQQLKLNWKKELDRLAETLNPFHNEIFSGFPVEYYWSTFESEWATDVMFRKQSELVEIYSPVILHAITTFGCSDVLKFLGKKLDGRIRSEVVTDFRRRPEGVRIKHRAGKNSVKLYDKQGNVLRTETTINDPKAFKVFRTTEKSRNGQKKWHPLRHGIADLHRRANISQQANNRYLDSFACVDTSVPLGKFFQKLSQPVTCKGQRIRALRPTAIADLSLFAAVNNGKFCLNGFRNSDLVCILLGKPTSDIEKRKWCSRISRLLKLLRAHKLIYKVAHSHRYRLSKYGRDAISAILITQDITLQQLTKVIA